MKTRKRAYEKKVMKPAPKRTVHDVGLIFKWNELVKMQSEPGYHDFHIEIIEHNRAKAAVYVTALNELKYGRVIIGISENANCIEAIEDAIDYINSMA